MFEGWANDPRVTQYLTWNPHTCVAETTALLEEWCGRYQQLNVYKWAIEYQGRLIGCIDVVRMHEQNEYADLGYCLSYDYWGRGIMTEAARAVVDYLFGRVGFHRLTIYHVVENIGSGVVAKKCGFSREGVQREVHKTDHGTYQDLAFWSLLRREWDERRR